MKILMVNKFHFVKGGSERHYFDLSENFKNHGHEVIHFSMHHPNNEKTREEKYFTDFVQTEKITFNLAGIKSILKLWWNLDAAKKMEKIIQAEKPDLVHLHNISHQISPSILPKIKKYHLPIVMTMHDYKLVCPNGKMFTKGRVCEKCQGQKYFNCVRNKCVKNSYLASLATYLEMTLHHKILNVYKKNIDIFIAPSEFLKNKMIALSWPPEKIIHLPYFIPQKEGPIMSPLFQGGVSNEQSEIRGGGYILYFGRLSEEKGIDILIETMKNLSDIKLKIVGTGPKESKLKIQLTEHKMNNVEMLGYKSGEELNKIIEEANCVIVPSIWYEVTGLVILESYLNNTPVIASDIGGIPEVIKDQETGYLFQTGDSHNLAEKIKLIFKNFEDQKSMAENGKKMIAENHNPEKYYQEILKIYQSL